MARKWTLHTKKGKSGLYRKYIEQVVLIVNSRGEIVLSPATLKVLDNPEKVLLYEDKNVIGLKKCQPPDPEYKTNAYKVNFGSKAGMKKGKDTFGIIACKVFVRDNLKCNALYDDVSIENNILVIGKDKARLLHTFN